MNIEVIPQKIHKDTKLSLAAAKKVQVAAYARVSTDSDEQYTSFEAQVSYYTKKIQENPRWELVKVYADEGISGTSTKNREAFQDMITDAKNGKINMIITKSVSRFARNTVDSITTIRKLKEIGVGVIFEKENINTLDSTGELLLTIMSSLAQEESRSISENVTWGIRKRMSDGKYSLGYSRFLGFEKGRDGKPIINKEEAEIVKRIYREYLEGKSTHQIVSELEADKIPTPAKKVDKDGNLMCNWRPSTIISILANEKYKGDALLQKTYVTDFLSHKAKKNNGELSQYYIKDSHEAIIPPEEWEMVQVETARRNKPSYKHSGATVFSSKVVCGDCGAYYGLKVWHSTDKYRKTIYQCNHKFKRTEKCSTPNLSEERIKQAFIDSLSQLDRAQVLEDCNLAIETLRNDDTSEVRVRRLNAEIEVVVELVKKNPNMEQVEIDAYVTKYEDLVKKLNAEEHRLESKCAAIKRVEVFAANLKNLEPIIAEFSPRLWNLLLEKAIVGRDDTIKFVYYSGIENTVKI